MLPVTLPDSGKELKVLCLGAHCDDIEIGCGGTLLKMKEEFPLLNIKWVVFTSTSERETEAHRSADFFLTKINSKEVVVKDFKDGFLPFQAEQVKMFFEELKAFQPDVIFTHYRHDLHQDHRIICELTWNTFRNHLILEYEIPKYDGDLGHPNFFVLLTQDQANEKAEAIMSFFGSQKNKQWFDQEAFLSLMRIRGLECASKTRYAEGFYVRKLVW
jgi:LmbE family N-acetylglucosaminyl deacetylase